jgi:integrase
MYVVKRNGVYQFRKPIPNSLQALFGRGDVRVSLRTTQAAVAHRRALEMLVHVEDIFHMLRSERPADESRRLVVSMLEHAIKTMRGTPATFYRDLTALNDTIAELKSHQDLNRASETAVFSSNDIKRLEELVTQAVQDGHKARFSEETLFSAIEAYKRKIAPLLSGKHGADVPIRLDFFLSVVRDMPCRDLRRAHMEAFRDLLDQLPEKWQQRFPDAGPVSAITLNAKRKEPFGLLSPVTINLKYLGPVRRFLDELVRSEKIERNPAAGLESARTKGQHKTAPNQKRLPFKIDQLNCILSAASLRPKTRAVYWTPPGMLLTGARLNEFCQLRTNDLVVHNNRPHLSILCLEDEDAEGTEGPKKKKEHERRVKSPAGRRLIPVHNKLIELGFLEFIESRRGRGGSHGQLFREIKPDKYGYFSGAVSKALNLLIKNAGAASPLRSVYSFRHNFSDVCDAAQMPERTKNKLMGHQLEGAPGVYGNSLPEPHESEWIDKVTYAGVDFSSYRQNPKEERHA